MTGAGSSGMSGAAGPGARYCTGTAGAEDAGLRLDQFATQLLGLASRAQIRRRLIAAQVNGRTAKLSYRINAGDLVEVTVAPPRDMAVRPEPIPLTIIYQDEDVLVIDKPQGMVVHPGAGVTRGTLVAAVASHLQRHLERFPDDPVRPGIVHRLDRDTSGVIIVACHLTAHAVLARQFAERRVGKRYLALVHGVPSPRRGRIDAPIGRHPRDRKRFAVVTAGRPSISRYRVVRELVAPSGKKFALIVVAPRTGRTHQIRVHLKHIGVPIVGDPIYGGGRDPAGSTLLLHASSLTIRLPSALEDDARRFRAPMPDRFTRALVKLDGDQSD